MRVLCSIVVSALAVAATACGSSEKSSGSGPVTVPCAGTTLPPLSTETFVSGLDRPIFMTQAVGVDDTFYVLEQTGHIQLVRDGAVVSSFLDLQATIQCADPGTCLDGGNRERGLLGLALHPNYAQNGRFFVYYATLNAPIRDTLVEYQRSAANPDQADPTPVATILDEADPETNHNGGMLAFGHDGFLYFSLGDGGGGCDNHGTNGNAQDTSSPFGKIHRFDVDNAAGNYAAAGNPFTTTGLNTVWAYGLRNPWRFTFDRVTHDIWIADVGQDSYEEIDFQPGTSQGGENYGWRPLEGNCSSAASGCTTDVADGCLSDAEITALGYVPPVFVAPQASGPTDLLSNPSSICGGYVYRGSAIPDLKGWYLFGDSGSDSRAAIRMCDGEFTAVGAPDLELAAPALVSFSEDNAGELYMVSQGNGSIVKIVAGP